MHFFPAILRKSKPTYRELCLTDEKSSVEDDDHAREPTRRLIWGALVTYTLIAALAMSLVSVSILYLQQLQLHIPQPLLTCGNSIKESRERGCSFDRLTKTWLPAACPRYYEDEFLQYPLSLNMTEWKYWTDRTAMKEITDEDMAEFVETTSRDETSWVSSMRMHLVHCAFGLKRRSRALDAGERLDYATAPLDHTHHCIDLLLETAMKAAGIDEPLAGGHVIFGAC
jgi:hypothetical protein